MLQLLTNSYKNLGKESQKKYEFFMTKKVLNVSDVGEGGVGSSI